MATKTRHNSQQPATVKTEILAAEWLKPGIVGKPFGIGRTMIYELITTGKIRSAKIGKARLVSVASLRAYIEGLAAAEAGKVKIHIG